MDIPPAYGPLAAVTPGTPGGLMVMMAEYGRLSLADVLAPSIDMARGYPIEAQAANSIEGQKDRLAEWPYSKEVFLPHYGQDRAAPAAGEIFVQEDLARTLEQLVETEAEALAAGATRRDAIMAAYDRFYRGDIAEEFVRGSQEQGGLHTLADLADWQVYLEEPVSTSYKGIDVYKLTTWVQGPVLLQALNILEGLDVGSMGYNSTRYIHALYQAMNLAFADRDFYYGDPYFPPAEPIEGLLSKEYAAARAATIDWDRKRPGCPARRPVPLPGWHESLPASHRRLERRTDRHPRRPRHGPRRSLLRGHHLHPGRGRRRLGRVGHPPRAAGSRRSSPARTGIGMSQRMQSFVLDERAGPYNVVEPGKRPRATLTPSLALRDGEPFLSFAVQGGDGQDQNLLQFFLNVVEFDMNVQQAGRGGQLQQLPDAELLRCARVAARAHPPQRRRARVGPRRAARHGLRPDLRPAHLGSDQRDLLRRRHGHDVGRRQQPRGRLRDRVVTEEGLGGGEGGAGGRGRRITIDGEGHPPVSGIMVEADSAAALLVLVHGAGAPHDTPRSWRPWPRRWRPERISTLRYNFAYAEAGRRRPDHVRRLLAVVRSALRAGT